MIIADQCKIQHKLLSSYWRSRLVLQALLFLSIQLNIGQVIGEHLLP